MKCLQAATGMEEPPAQILEAFEKGRSFKEKEGQQQIILYNKMPSNLHIHYSKLSSHSLHLGQFVFIAYHIS